MNNIITHLRASLLISNVSSLMFIKSNGPPIEVFKLFSFNFNLYKCMCVVLFTLHQSIRLDDYVFLLPILRV
jgi:hypothetical protein